MYQTICILIVILIVALSSVLLITYNSFSSACAYVTPMASSPPMFTNVQLMDLAAAGVGSTSPASKEKTYDELVLLPDSTIITNLKRLYPDGKVPTSSNYSQFIIKKTFYWDASKKEYARTVYRTSAAPLRTSPPMERTSPPPKDGEVPYSELVKKSDQQLIENLNKQYGKDYSSPGQVPITSQYTQFFKDSKFYWDSKSQTFAVDPDASDKDEVAYPILATRDDDRNLRNLNRLYGSKSSNPGAVPATSEYQQFFINQKYTWDSSQGKYVLGSSTTSMTSTPGEDNNNVPYDVLKTRDDTVNLQNLNNMYGRTGKYLSTNAPGYVSEHSEYKQFFENNKYLWNEEHQQFELVPPGPSFQYQFI